MSIPHRFPDKPELRVRRLGSRLQGNGSGLESRLFVVLHSLTYRTGHPLNPKALLYSPATENDEGSCSNKPSVRRY